MLPDNITIRGIKGIQISVTVIGKDRTETANSIIDVDSAKGASLQLVGEALSRASYNSFKIALEKACKEE